MLFNSISFLFIFLPVVWIVHYFLKSLGRRHWTESWLILASLVFYSGMIWKCLPVLLGSVFFNYGITLAISRQLSQNRAAPRPWLLTGLAGNLLLLVTTKYVPWFGLLLGALPVGISFYTFVQIRHLLDVYQGSVALPSFREYLLSISFFPYVTAGPLIRPAQVISQFKEEETKRHVAVEEVLVGAMLFSMGLFKKVAVADSLSHMIDPIFSMAMDNHSIPFFSAWFAAIGFAFQIYFDFSGYSDMAIGVARLFGIRIPVNFNSPFKATNIGDFWKRWHMTLTQFLMSTVYAPLALFFTRRQMAQGKPMLDEQPSLSAYFQIVFFPSVFTMLIVGLWHGAGASFVVFGLLHGFYLSFHQGWSLLHQGPRTSARVSLIAKRALTFGCVLVSFVFFRSASISGALTMLKGMFDVYGMTWTRTEDSLAAAGLLLILSAVLWFAPNSQELLSSFEQREDMSSMEGEFTWTRWRPDGRWAFFHGAILAISLWMLAAIAEPPKFIYFKF